MSFIPYGRQDISEEDIAAVVGALRSDWLTQGPQIRAFEEAMAARCGARHAISVANGTAALHLAALAAGLGPGDRLWTSPNTFVASANCALYCGAEVDFVDIDPRTYNMSAEGLQKKLEIARKEDRLPKVIVPVHFAGQSPEMECIRAMTQKYGITIIEDASHAVGAEYQGRPVGDCSHCEMTTFSFHPVKIMTTGEGGMILTNRDDLADKLRLLSQHGITRDASRMQTESHGPWYYEQIDLGFNYRITDLQSALGQSQLKRLPEFLRRRREIAARYDELLKALPLTLPWQRPDTLSSWHLYVIRLHLEKIGKTRRQIFEELREVEIGVQVHYIPVHIHPEYQQRGFRPGDFPNAEEYYEEALSLPIYASLTDDQQDRVVDCLQQLTA